MPTCICPCGARYKVPDTSVGKKAKCKKCGETFLLEDDEAPIAIAEEPKSAIDEEIAERLRQVSSPDFKPEILAPVTGPGLPSISTRVISTDDSSTRGYFADLFSSLFFIRDLGNLFAWIVVSVIMILSIFFPFQFGLLGIAAIGIQGWYCAFRFGVIEEAAAGKANLPELISSDWIDDIVKPLGLWILSLLLAYLPAVIAGVFMVSTGAISSGDIEEIMTQGVAASVSGDVWAKAGLLVAMLLLGLFLWPMVVLCFALGGLSCLSRPDLIITTIMKTFPVYLLTVVLVHGVDFALGFLAPTELLSTGTILQRVLTVYADVFAMRAIGLYYYHFKNRFAWSWG